jgi:fumarate hydratase subunit alpha
MFDKQLLENEIHDLIIRSCLGISGDVRDLMEKTLARETNPGARNMMQSMLDNLIIAKSERKPICQSPGYPTVYVSSGEKSLPGDFKSIFAHQLVQATNEGLLRPSIVHPLTRKNPGDNSGEGVPNYEIDYVTEQEYLEMIISSKGCGAELGNIMKIMTTATLGENLSGLKKMILEAMAEAGGKPCPPVGVGIGIGGQMDVACKLSRKAISVRRWDDENPDPLYDSLEKELLEQINSLGLGAAGTGGDTYALAVKILGASTHTAIAPVAVNFHCWVVRRAGVRLYLDGRREIIF